MKVEYRDERMMRIDVKVKRVIEAGSYYTYLPEGCKLCRKGAKLVLFITGECYESCYYCPISDERKGRDVIYANERRVYKFGDIIDEINSMSAEGVAITGGEPLLKFERIKEILRALNNSGIHVHLYTSIPANERIIRSLSEVGVDEIRFHPPYLRNPERYINSIKSSIKYGIEVGFEIPAIRFEESIVKITNELDIFLNVNELEFSDSNFERMQTHKWEIGYCYEAIGSKEIADRYAEVVKKFHFCSVRFKDIAQFRRRLIRMAFNMPEFYKVTNDGTVICALIECDESDRENVREYLMNKKANFFETDDGFEVSEEFVEKNLREILNYGFKVSIIERYPTYNRIIIEKSPLR